MKFGSIKLGLAFSFLLIGLSTVKSLATSICTQVLNGSGISKDSNDLFNPLKNYYGDRLKLPMPGEPLRLRGETEFQELFKTEVYENGDSGYVFSGIPFEKVNKQIQKLSGKDGDPIGIPTTDQVKIYEKLYKNVFENFLLATWNFRAFKGEKNQAKGLAKVIKVVRPVILSVQELESIDACVGLANNELRDLYEPIYYPHSKNRNVSQVGFYVLKGLPFNIEVRSYFNHERFLFQKAQGGPEKLFLHDLLVADFYLKGVNKKSPFLSILNMHLKSPSRIKDSNFSERRHEAYMAQEDQAIEDIIEHQRSEHPTTPLIIQGDANREIENSNLGHLLKAKGWTKPKFGPTILGRILEDVDVILSPNSLPAASSKTYGLDFEKSVWPSDHGMVTATFNIFDLIKNYLLQD